MCSHASQLGLVFLFFEMSLRNALTLGSLLTLRGRLPTASLDLTLVCQADRGQEGEECFSDYDFFIY